MKIRDYLDSLGRSLGREPRIGFVGLGVSNTALIEKAGCRDITVRIDKPAHTPDNRKYRIITGEQALSDIDEDVLFLSPSVRRDRPELAAAVSRGTRILSDAELFFLDTPSFIYGVTGSDGKSTTATVAAMLLKEKHPEASPIGNIGIPFASAEPGAAVAELSSFQLSYMSPHLRAAVITPITPNHLDWHRDIGEYVEAKTNIFKNAERRAITPDTPYCAEIASREDIDIIYSTKLKHGELSVKYRAEHYLTLSESDIFLDGEPLVPISACARRERHNLHNLMGAIALTLGECSTEHILNTARGFCGLEHRCERFLRINGTDFINSSIDTTPSRTAATLSSLERRVRLILGGRGKHLPLAPALELIEKYADRISLYGEAGEEFYPELKGAGITARIDTELFPTLREAIEHALFGITEGETLLLSPAATGYGEFRDFSERGRYFKNYITEKYKDEDL